MDRSTTPPAPAAPWRAMTREQLEIEYSPRLLVPDLQSYLDRYAELSRAARAALPVERDIAYGATPDEVLDFFRAAAFGAALKAADFQSVTGPFRFNTNHFPIRNFYRVDVVKDASGQAVFATKGTVFTDHADAYSKECPLK